MRENTNTIDVNAVTSTAFNEFYVPVRESTSEPDALELDTFAMLYQRIAKLKDEPPDPAATQAISSFVESQTYSDVHNRTALDHELSAAVTPAIYTELLELVTRERQRLEEEQREQEKLESAADEKAQQAQRETLRKLAARHSRERIADRKLALQTLKRAQDALDTSEMLASMGWGNERGQFVKAAIADKQLRKTAELVRKIKDWFGRLMAARAEALTRVPAKGPEIKGIKFGADLSALHPFELVRLGDPDLSDLFWIAYAERRLMLWDTESQSKEAARGDAVVLVDESGSMDGEPVAYAKAFAFVLRLEAERDGRICEIASFSHDAADIVRLPAGASQKEALAWLGRFISGGTDFVPPLKLAMELTQSESLRKPDIVILSDGCCKVSDEFSERFAEFKGRTGARLYWFRFGSGDGLGQLAERSYNVALDNDQLVLQPVEEFTQEAS